MILTTGGKCAFCGSEGQYTSGDSYGWRHSQPVCDLFIGALKQTRYVKPLADNSGWEVLNENNSPMRGSDDM